MADTGDFVDQPYPLAGAIICCTSLSQEDRQSVTKKAIEMGARAALDLTSDVTHLICAAVTSPKYRYVAQKRADVKVLRVSWIHAMYKEWLEGEDIDSQAFERDHRFPTFYGLSISVTGIADVAERKRIEDLCLKESATYHPDLTKFVSHLIAAAPTGKKYDFAVHNKIAVVTTEWLDDSLERGMALNESYYNPQILPEKIGVGAKPEPSQKNDEPVGFKTKRKIRRSTGEIIGNQSQKIWDDIIGAGMLVKPMVLHDEWEENEHEEEDDGPPVAPGRRSKNVTPQPGSPNRKSPKSSKPKGLFGEVCFFVWGFTDRESSTLRSILRSYDGEIVTSHANLQESNRPWKYAIFPRKTMKKDYPVKDPRITVVTDWWVELCIHTQSFVEPTESDITTMPFETVPIRGFENFNICITHFSSIDLLHWGRLLPLMGVKLHEVLNTKRTLLLTSQTPPTSAKGLYAASANIPIIASDWFLECIRQQKVLPHDKYQVYLPPLKQRSVPLPLPPPPVFSPSHHLEKRSLLGDRFKRKAEQPPPAEKEPTEETPKKQRSDEEPTPKKKQRPDEELATEGERLRNIPQPPISEAGGQSNGESKKMCGRKILDGCTICISHQLGDCMDELSSLAASLGAKVIDTFGVGDAVTHLIHEPPPGAGKDTSKDFRTATEIGCFIVSPSWLLTCSETSQLANEAAFPPAHPIVSTAPPPTNRESSVTTASSTSLSPVPTHLPSTAAIIPPAEPLMDCPPNPRTTTPRKLSTAASSLLNKFTPSHLSATSKGGRPPPRLKGRAVPGTNRGFSRTPSFASDASAQMSSQMAASQGVAYGNDEDAESERRRVRQKLDPTAEMVEVEVKMEGRAVAVDVDIEGGLESRRRTSRRKTREAATTMMV